MFKSCIFFFLFHLFFPAHITLKARIYVLSFRIIFCGDGLPNTETYHTFLRLFVSKNRIHDTRAISYINLQKILFVLCLILYHKIWKLSADNTTKYKQTKLIIPDYVENDE